MQLQKSSLRFRSDGWSENVSRLTGLRLLSRVGRSGAKYTICPRPGFYTRAAGVAVGFGAGWDVCSCISGERRIPAGAAHFLEHILFKKNDRNIADEMGDRGASCNAETGLSYTAYYFDCPTNFDENLSSLMDIVFDSTLTVETVEAERGIILAEYYQYIDSPHVKAMLALRRSLFGDGNFGSEIAGTPDSIGVMTQKDLAELHSAFYTPPALHFVAVGDIDEREFMETVERRIAGLPSYGKPPEKKVELSSVVDTTRIEFTDNTPRPLMGIAYRFSLPSIEDDERRRKVGLALSLGTKLLFGDSSALYTELLDSGLADESFSHVISADGEQGYLILGSGTNDPDALCSKLESALSTKNLRLAINDRALDVAKRRFAGKAVFATGSIGSTLGMLLGPASGRFPVKRLNEDFIESVTVRQLVSVLRRSLSEFPPARVLVRPRGD
ncbi:MAG: pitrilysin family protein [Candidatus Brocadiia bacterium]